VVFMVLAPVKMTHPRGACIQSNILKSKTQ
jgi:hypothetical protein